MPVTNLVSLLSDMAHRSPDAIAVSHRAKEHSYSDMLQAVEAVAAGLAFRGVLPGDRVAIWLPKQVEMVVSLWACSHLAAVFIPVNPALKPQQVGYILEDSGAKILITSEQRREALLEADVWTDSATLKILTVETDWHDISRTPAKPPTPSHDTDLAAILYTSGSTGKPKGVMLSQRNLILGADSVAQYLELTAHDRILCVLPFSFDAGLNQLISSFKVGATAYLLDHLFAKDVLVAVERHQITGLGLVPPLWIQLADLDMARASNTLRYISNTGGRMPLPVLKSLREKLPQTKIFLMYGLTEAFRSTYLDPALVDEVPTSVGKAIPHAEVRVVRKDGTETLPNEVGELVHAGPLVALGYWQDADRTAARFRPAPTCFPSALAGTPAVFSGDSFSRDEQGLLYFVGRDDEMIKTSGYRVSPTEIEEAFYGTGDVREAVAIGIADRQLGAAIVVALVPKYPGQVDLDAIQRKVRVSLPAYMLPKHIQLSDELPRSPNGKLDRVEISRSLRAQFEEVMV